MRKPLITIETVRHEEQRYDTWGDWEVDGHRLTITISEVPDVRHLYLAAIHELLEAIVFLHEGGTQADVDEFDVDYEKRRMAGHRVARCGCEITDDPGSDPHAPYRTAHTYAESVEYGLAKLLDVDPKEYDADFITLDGGVAGNRKD